MTRRAPSAAERRQSRRFAYLLVVFVVSLLLVDALVGDKGLLETLRVKRRYYALQTEIDRLKRENARLAEEARRLRNDPAAIESVARGELGLIRPGERVFIIKDKPVGKPSPPRTPSADDSRAVGTPTPPSGSAPPH